MRGRKTRRLHVDIEEVEDRLTLQGLLRQDQIDSINEVEPHRLG